MSVSSFTPDLSAMHQLTSLTKYATRNSTGLLVGVILPDETSSARWVDFDQPYLTDALLDAGFSSSQFNIQNAQGSDPTAINDATADINSGAKVLIVAAEDGPTGLSIAALAAAHHVKLIAYDRAIFPPTGTVYVSSFNYFTIGQQIAKGFESCVTSEGVKNPQVYEQDGGKNTDPNAITIADGMDSVLFGQQPTGTNELTPGTKGVGSASGYTLVEDEYSPGWSTTDAETEFQEAFTAHPNINAVITANDEMNAEVITDLQAANVKAGTIPTTGQDATPQAMAYILEGWQCGTVYRPIYGEAEAAVVMADALLAGDTIPSGLLNGTLTDPANSAIKEPASMANSEWVTASSIESTVVKDGFVSASTICGEVPAALCTKYGIH
jgi:D-xylose transport system substrate-binding protein